MGPSAAYLQKENFVRKRNCSKKTKKSNIFKKGTWMANVLIGCVCLKKNQYVYLSGTMENDDSVSNNSRKEEKKKEMYVFFFNYESRTEEVGVQTYLSLQNLPSFIFQICFLFWPKLKKKKN